MLVIKESTLKERCLEIWDQKKKYSIPTLLILLVLNYFHLLDYTCQLLGLGLIRTYTEANLGHIIAESTQLCLDIGALDASINILKSIQFGIDFIADFNVQIGNMFIEFSRLAGHAWTVSIASVVSLECVKFIFRTPRYVSESLVSVIILLSLIKPLTKKLNYTTILIRTTQKVIGTLLILLYVVIPLTVTASAFTSKMTLSPIKQTIITKIKNHQNEFKTGSLDDIKKHLSLIHKNYDSEVDHHSHGIRDFTHTIIQHLWVCILDTIIVPGFLLFIIWIYIKHSYRWIINQQKQTRVHS